MPPVPDEPTPLTRAERRARERLQSAATSAVPPVVPSAASAVSESLASESAASGEQFPATTPAVEPASGVTARDRRSAEAPAATPAPAPATTPVPAPATEFASAPAASKRKPKRAPRPRRRATFFSVLGELLITAGVLMVLFVVWQLWYNDMVERAAQNQAASSLSEQWQQEFTPPATPPPASGEPPVIAAPEDGVVFATLRVPRFGADYVQEIAGGVSKARTLDSIGIGHYLTTGLPGQAGNFGLAGHRNTHGAPLNAIGSLRVGDAIVVETREGWFTYRYRTTEYVQPSQGEVLNPMPQTDIVETTDSIITLTSCNPKMSTAERIIAYGVFESFTPRTEAQTLPASLTDPVEG